MNNSAKILTAVAAGAAAGAIFGILFAPDKGSETRKKINSQGEKIADELKNRFRKGKDRLNELKVDIEKKVNEMEKRVNEKVEEFA